VYLAPGDYHGFHAPTEWTVEDRSHFQGLLLSVSSSAVRAVRDLFAINERVVYSGKWLDGRSFFSFSAVGATNVGSIVVPADSELATNRPQWPEPGDAGGPLIARFDGWRMRRGDYFGAFNLGSTVVLIFEVPADMKADLAVVQGQRVKMGQPVIHLDRLPLSPHEGG